MKHKIWEEHPVFYSSTSNLWFKERKHSLIVKINFFISFIFYDSKLWESDSSRVDKEILPYIIGYIKKLL